MNLRDGEATSPSGRGVAKVGVVGVSLTTSSSCTSGVGEVTCLCPAGSAQRERETHNM